VIPANPSTYAHFIHRRPSGRVYCNLIEVLAWNDDGRPMVFSQRDQELVPAAKWGNFAGVEFDGTYIECGHTTDIHGNEPRAKQDSNNGAQD
jgi:hypothetical protein